MIAGLLFMGGLRRSEVAALCWADVTDAHDGDGVLLTVRTSKTNQEGDAADVRYLKNGAANAIRTLRAAAAAAPTDRVIGLSPLQIQRRFTAAAPRRRHRGARDGAQWPGRARVRTDGARRVHHGSHAGRQLENRPHGRALLGRRDRRTRGRPKVSVGRGLLEAEPTLAADSLPMSEKHWLCATAVIFAVFTLALLWPDTDGARIRASDGGQYERIAFNMVRYSRYHVSPRLTETSDAGPYSRREPGYPLFLATVFALSPEFPSLTHACISDSRCAAAAPVRRRVQWLTSFIQAVTVAATFLVTYTWTGSWLVSIAAGLFYLVLLPLDTAVVLRRSSSLSTPSSRRKPGVNRVS